MDGYRVYLERGVDAVRRWKAFGAADQRRLEATGAPVAEEDLVEEDEEGEGMGSIGGHHPIKKKESLISSNVIKDGWYRVA